SGGRSNYRHGGTDRAHRLGAIESSHARHACVSGVSASSHVAPRHRGSAWPLNPRSHLARATHHSAESREFTAYSLDDLSLEDIRMHMPKFVRLLAAIALVGISAWPGTLVAQKARATSLGVGGGLTMPIGDYSDCCGSGFNVGGFVQWRQPDQVFGLRGEVQYNRNNVKEAWIDTPGVTGHADMLNF